MFVDQDTYRKAFQTYLRNGAPILRSIKQDQKPAYYIWRTQGDTKVRGTHAQREGQIFSWDTAPEGGHPGEDYNCRCHAEPYTPASEFMQITLQNVSDEGDTWTSQDFVEHYFSGNGQGVTVRETGHLSAIVEQYMALVEDKLKGQIASEARLTSGGSFTYPFGRPYDMEHIAFSIGDTTIGGVAYGQVKKVNNSLSVQGSLDFYLRDMFADPLDIGVEVDDYTPGSIGHDLDHVIDDLGEILDPYEQIHKPIEDYVRDRVGLKTDDAHHQKHMRTGRDGVPYPITDIWSGQFIGQVHTDAAKSNYVKS